MPDPVWYKSLYWRIAFGFVAMLAAVLLAQGLVLLWLTDRVVGWSAQTPAQLVTSVATELSAALRRFHSTRTCAASSTTSIARLSS
jgi:nitric oxide reductase large subunit